MTSTVKRAVLIVGAVTVVAGGLRLYGLGDPPRKIFDEVYYASDGCLYAGRGSEECELEDGERSWVHPPLGKEIISWGVHGFGNRPLGWRVTAAAAGTGVVALVGVLAFLLWGRPLWAGVAALLAATEHLLFVQSRIAMLDVFLTFFVVLAFVLLTADRRRRDRDDAALIPVAGGAVDTEADASPAGARIPIHWRPLRIGAGAAFGAAVAVKWSGVLALLAGLILAAAWERTRERRIGARRPLRAALRRDGLGLYGSMVVVPVLVYLITWIPWLADHGFDMVAFIRNHGSIAGFHLGLETVENGEPIHPYMSRAWSWLLLGRPVAYFWEGGDACCRAVLGMGNPAMFWGALAILPYLAWAWLRRGDWRAGAVLVPVLAQYLPWLIVSRPLFLFYMAPVAPFLALGFAYVVRDIARVGAPERRTLVPAAAALVAVAVGMFVFFWPILVGSHLSHEAWKARIWFQGWV